MPTKNPRATSKTPKIVATDVFKSLFISGIIVFAVGQVSSLISLGFILITDFSSSAIPGYFYYIVSLIGFIVSVYLSSRVLKSWKMALFGSLVVVIVGTAVYFWFIYNFFPSGS